MNTITDAELNRRLAEGLGWVVVDHEMFTPDPCDLWLDLETGRPVCKVADFSPATDRNHLAEYVLSEISQRGLAQGFIDQCFRPDNILELGDEEDTYGWWLLTASPRVLALAALKVLEEKK